MDGLVGRTVGSYRLLERIGAGGMGDVYKAVHVGIGAKVAIKVLNATGAEDPNANARFLREAQAVNRIEHDSVVKISDVGRLDPEGRMYLVMELLDGEPLADVLARSRRPPLGTTCRIIDSVLAVAGAAHAHGIVHRDLKPHNVFLTRTGRTVVLDFGVAKLLDVSSAARLTATGAVVGTPHYMAPEQIRAEHVDPRSDLYAIGCILYEMVVGRRPFTGDPAVVIEAQLAQRPPPPRELCPDVPEPVQAVILKALEKQPDQRFQSAAEMRGALAAATAALPAEAFAPLALAPPAVTDASVPPAFPTTPDAAPSTRDGVPTIRARHAPRDPAVVAPPPPANAPARRSRRRWGIVLGGVIGSATIAIVLVVVSQRGAAPPANAPPITSGSVHRDGVDGAGATDARSSTQTVLRDRETVARLMELENLMSNRGLLFDELPRGRELRARTDRLIREEQFDAADRTIAALAETAQLVVVDRAMAERKLARARALQAAASRPLPIQDLDGLIANAASLIEHDFATVNRTLTLVIHWLAVDCTEWIDILGDPRCIARYCEHHPTVARCSP